MENGFLLLTFSVDSLQFAFFLETEYKEKRIYFVEL